MPTPTLVTPDTHLIHGFGTEVIPRNVRSLSHVCAFFDGSQFVHRFSNLCSNYSYSHSLAKPTLSIRRPPPSAVRVPRDPCNSPSRGRGSLWKPDLNVASILSSPSAGPHIETGNVLFTLNFLREGFSHTRIFVIKSSFSLTPGVVPSTTDCGMVSIIPACMAPPRRSLLEPIACELGSPPELIHCDDPIRHDRNALSSLLCLLGYMIVTTL